MKRLWITGAAGFIGSRLAIRAAQAGHPVLATSRQEVPLLHRTPGVSTRIVDVLDAKTLEEPLAADLLVHCATPNDIVSRDFGAGMRLSIEGTRNVLEAAVRAGIREVLFFSTLQVYGTELEGTITEATPPRCESPYGLNHLLGEEVCRYYARKHGLKVALIRPANVYGVPDSPTVKRSTLVPMCFVQDVLANGHITLHSSGLQRRNFISTDEVAEVCLHLARNPREGVNVINAASNWTASILEIGQMVAAALPGVTIQARSDHPSGGHHLRVDSSLASLRRSVEESRDQMRSVISSLLQTRQQP
jgi:nucleoside-diphosphate-sugar epimerase